MRCQICGSEGSHQRFEAREMMFGLRDTHLYFMCSDCGCLQIETPPVDVSRYYGEDYYSFANEPASGMKSALIGYRNHFKVFGRGLLGALLARAYPTTMFDFLEPVSAQLTPESQIADVGCGGGRLLGNLRLAGLHRVIGVDPFIRVDVQFGGDVLVRKAGLESLRSPLDLLMFHHSFEHMPYPVGTLTTAAGLLAPTGCCILRLPLVSSLAWQRFGVNWVQLDAPRHFYLHSDRSIRVLAERCGLECFHVTYDSTEFQFWGSEQYRQDIPLRDPRSYAVDPGKAMFSAADMARFTAEAKAANAAGLGDQAAFYLRRRG